VREVGAVGVGVAVAEGQSKDESDGDGVAGLVLGLSSEVSVSFRATTEGESVIEADRAGELNFEAFTGIGCRYVWEEADDDDMGCVGRRGEAEMESGATCDGQGVLVDKGVLEHLVLQARQLPLETRLLKRLGLSWAHSGMG
jgi:hypothetical protein